MIFIPTDRECVRAIVEALAEADWVVAGTGEDTAVCLIDSTSPATQDRHRRALLAEVHAGVRVLHLTPRVQADIVHRLAVHAGAAGKELPAILLGPRVSYGRGPDLASLIAQALGARSIHRRDSDVFRDTTRPTDHAVELELSALGRPISALEARPGDQALPPEAPVAMAGTSVFGAPPIDRSALFDAAPEAALRLQELGRPGRPTSESAAEMEGYFLTEPTTRYDDDFLSLEGRRVEMGSAGMTDALFRAVPEMSAGIIGSDYLRKDFCWQMRWPVIFHSRKAEHIWDDRRHADTATFVGYGMREIQYLQLGRIWATQTTRFAAARDPRRSARANASVYARCFVDAAHDERAFIAGLRTDAATIYRDAARSTRGAARERFAAVATQVDRCGARLDRTVQIAIEDFARLTEGWQALLDGAESYGRGLVEAVPGNP